MQKTICNKATCDLAERQLLLQKKKTWLTIVGMINKGRREGWISSEQYQKMAKQLKSL